MKKIDKKIDKKIITILFLSLIIIGSAGISAYSYIQEQAYQQGVQDATLLINQQMISSLIQNNYIPFFYTQNNQTYQLKLGVIE